MADATKAILLCLLVSRTAMFGQNPGSADLGKLDIEDLMNVKVTSVSKRVQSLSHTAAAVYVIRQEEIRRSGATSIPDLLRMVPGVDVAQIDANAWAISIRGFSSRYSNKVLVMIDGRSVYTRSFSGVYWDQIDMPLENIDRIEVIRGPGATVWGVNAVNGVISIFTKSSEDTKGGLASVGAGTQTHGLGLAQYGGNLGSKGSYLAFARSFQVGSAAFSNGQPANDRWRRAQGGFRTDFDLSERDSVMVEGDLFSNEENQTRRGGLVASPFDVSYPQSISAAGGNLAAHWDHTLKGGSQTAVHAYFDTYRRADLDSPELLRTFDVDFQHHLTKGTRHEIVWGFGYRVSRSGVAPGYPMSFTPPLQVDNLYSVFVQDEIRVTDTLGLTLGCKLEHNSYRTLENEPSIRLVWTAPGGGTTLWASAAKAIRQPSRADTSISTDAQNVTIAPGIVQILRLTGNPAVADEKLRDYEFGYRAEMNKVLSFDATTFLSFYQDLVTLDPQTTVLIPGSPLVIQTPLVAGNGAHARTYGGEISLTWETMRRWRLSPGYSYLHATVDRDPASHGPSTASISTDFPEHMIQLRSRFNLTRRMDCDQALYYTARLPGGKIPGHARVDLRLARRFGESTEISVAGQNLLRPRTTEYGNSIGVQGTQAVRSVYAKLTFRF